MDRRERDARVENSADRGTRSENHRARSRSPERTNSHYRQRDDQSVGHSSSSPNAEEDPVAKAAAIAARLAAQLKGSASSTPADQSTPLESNYAPTSTERRSTASILKTFAANQELGHRNNSSGYITAEKDMYVYEGDYLQDIEVNDNPNRYLLTKGPTQVKIKEATGADVTTRGKYYPDKLKATEREPPLFLHITAASEEILKKAVEMIRGIMAGDAEKWLGDSMKSDREKERDRDRETRDKDREKEYQERQKWKSRNRVEIGFESVPGFNIRSHILGKGGQNVKHIGEMTGCRVQIKGRGSNYMERDTGQEEDVSPYLQIYGVTADEQLESARAMCEDLIAAVREEYNRYIQYNNRHYNQHRGSASPGGAHRPASLPAGPRAYRSNEEPESVRRDQRSSPMRAYAPQIPHIPHIPHIPQAPAFVPAPVPAPAAVPAPVRQSFSPPPPPAPSVPRPPPPQPSVSGPSGVRQPPPPPRPPRDANFAPPPPGVPRPPGQPPKPPGARTFR